MPSPLSLADVTTQVSQADAASTILGALQGLDFPVTSWQDGDVAKILVLAFALGVSLQSTQAVQYVAGGFLDFAAQVTPDPSVTPGVAPGWLDILASSAFGVNDGQGGTGRRQATFAPANLVFTNTGSSQGPFLSGTFHVLNPANGLSYKNVSSLTIPNGVTSPLPFVCETQGATSSGPATITKLVTTLVGVSVTNPTSAIGSAAESNAQLVQRCRNKWASLSPNGPRNAYDYVAKTIPLPSPIVPLVSGLLVSPRNPVTKTKQIVDTLTGFITNYVSGASGPYTGADQYTGSIFKPVTGVTNASPPQITVAAHGYVTGNNVYINGTGIPSIDNQTYPITVVSGNAFTIPGPAPGATSAVGEAYRQSDLDLIAKTVATYCVPVGRGQVTTLSAPPFNVTVSGTITLRRGSSLLAVNVNSGCLSALAAYFASVPLGGDNSNGGPPLFFVDPMRAAIRSAFPNDILNVSLTSPAGDLSPSTSIDNIVLSNSSGFAVVQEL